MLTRDPFSISRRATENLQLPLKVEFLELPLHHNERDSVDAALAMRDAGCGSVVSLGGDGTNRALSMGWPDAPLIPLSTGTNNAFPFHVEPTVAGVAAGLIATGAVDLAAHSTRAKVVAVEVRGGDKECDSDLALIDAVAVEDPYVGSLEFVRPRDDKDRRVHPGRPVGHRVQRSGRHGAALHTRRGPRGGAGVHSAEQQPRSAGAGRFGPGLVHHGRFGPG